MVVPVEGAGIAVIVHPIVGNFYATGKTTVWGKEPLLVEARYTTEDSQERKHLLLASGWWGVARHSGNSRSGLGN